MESETNNAVAAVKEPSAVQHYEPQKDIYEQYGEEINARNIVGELLRFSKGDWSTANGEEFPIGKKMIVNMDQLLFGWIRWEDQKPVDQRMGLLIEGFRPPARNTLGYGYEPGRDDPVDTSEWEVDDTTHQPRDPWQFTYYLVMKDPEVTDETEGVYTFTTSSSGGRNAIGDLCKSYGRKRREGFQKTDPENGLPVFNENGDPVVISGKNFFPIVALKVGSYMHQNKSFGKIKTPGLPITGWVPKTVFGTLPSPVDATTQIVNARKEEIPF